jgi:hypothetical protein
LVTRQSFFIDMPKAAWHFPEIERSGLVKKGGDEEEWCAHCYTYVDWPTQGSADSRSPFVSTPNGVSSEAFDEFGYWRGHL